MADHYFSATPASADDRRTLTVDLADRTVQVQVAAGVFSSSGLDKGTRVLLADAPPPPDTGVFLDVGCGWGPIALTLGLLRPNATVWAVDVNERALDLTGRNAASLGIDGIRTALPADLPAHTTFDLIWSNPPIRVGKDIVHDVMRTWLPRLSPGGSAYLVVAKNLGADSLQRWLSAELSKNAYAVSRRSTSAGFRILQVDHLS